MSRRREALNSRRSGSPGNILRGELEGLHGIVIFAHKAKTVPEVPKHPRPYARVELGGGHVCGDAAPLNANRRVNKPQAVAVFGDG